jgi:putative ABC transport system permease protein
MPNDYRPNVEFWIPLPINYEGADRDFHDTTVIGRLAPGITIAKAQAEMDTIKDQLIRQYPDINTGWDLRVVPVHDSIVQNIREVLLILFGAVCFVLLIACTNVANLMLARAASREREIAIRTALGAGRFRLIRQVLTESVLIAVFGGSLGILIAVWGTRFLISLNPQGIPLSGEVGLDYRVLGFTVLVSIVSGIIFGIVPALQATKPDLNSAMKESGKSSTNARGGMIRDMLVVVEIAMALVLLIGAGLLIKSFARLQDVDPGFNREKLLTFQISLPPVHYTKPDQITGFYKDTIQKVSTLPGVNSAAAISVAPLASSGSRFIFYTEGKPLPTASEAPIASHRVVSPNYFETMGIPLIAGRTFTEADTETSLRTIIVNRELAKQMWPDQDPIGKRMTVGVPLALTPQVNYATVVGVVGDVKHTSLSGDTGMQMYQPLSQAPGLTMTLVLRGKADPTNLLDSIRSTVREIDPTLPLANVKTMDTIIYENVAPFRFNMFLLTLFAGVALVLTIIGVYGVMSYTVSQRTQEIGIRMALGAEPGEVRSMIIKKGLLLSLIGLAIGLGGSFAATWAMSSLLYGVSTTDPATFAVVAVILTVVALIACYIPARRATMVDPMIALRSE